MKEEKDIDKLFRDGLENPDLPYNELDWQALAAQLHPKPQKRRTSLFWAAALTGVAALLLIVFLVISPKNNQPKLAEENSHQPKEQTNPQTVSPLKNSGEVEKNAAVAEAYAKNKPKDEPQDRIERFTPRVDPTEIYFSATNTRQLASIMMTKIEEEPFQSAIAPALQQAKSEVVINSSDQVDVQIATTKNWRPKLALGITLAPDLTSVRNSGKSSLSGGIGIEATLAITKKLSITTGAAYAKKIYDADFSLYRPNTSYVFKNTPLNVHASCDVLDVPININYKLVANKRSSILVTSGLSSYFMLKEKYNYDYQNEYTAGPKSYQVNNQNRHLLGVANIGVTYQRQLNDRFSVNITPFVKVPLTDIGYGNSRLSSTGVAISVHMTNVFNKK